MKKIKRMLALVLAAIVMISAFAVPASAKGFTDIYNGHPYQDAINYVSDNEIMNGITPTEFAPNNAVTRAMMVTILYRKAGSPYVTIPTTGKFTDVPDTAYYAKAVYWAKDKSITNGTSTTTFSPNQTITREQAMCFLYNYSKIATVAVRDYFDNVNGAERSEVTTILSAYTDQSTISSYARPAMAWAAKRKVLVITEANKLLPKYTTSRVLAAYGITAFGTNVERIIYGKDNLNARNTSAYFSRDTYYYMTQAHLNKLKNAYAAYNPGLLVDDTIMNLGKPSFTDPNTGKKWEWNGACFGMSAITILDKLGKIAFNENYSSASTMNGATISKKTKAESAANYYQSAFHIVKTSGSTNFASKLNECITADGPVLFSYFWNTSAGTEGHSVVLNSCEKIDTTTYRLKVYDPNRWSEQTMTISTSGAITNSGILNATQLYYLSVIDDFSNFKKIDIDGATNTDNSSSTAATSNSSSANYLTDQSGFATLQIPLTGSFTVTNDQGQSLTWNDGLEGDMEIYSMGILPLGENTPAVLCLDVPVSDTFTFESTENADLTSFMVADPNWYSRVSGADIGKVTLFKSGNVEFNKINSKFEYAYSSVAGEAPVMILTATSDGSAMIDASESKISISGIVGEYQLKTISRAGMELNSISSVVESPSDPIDLVDGKLMESADME